MKAEGELRNQLKVVRARLGLSQADLASAAGVARQTIGGIEAELYAPSAAVALRLARALGCRVEELFWLEADAPTLTARFVGEGAEGEDTARNAQTGDAPVRVTLAQIGETWVAHPLQGEAAFRSEMVPADGLASETPEPGHDGGKGGSDLRTVRLLDDAEALARTVLLAGCAPALSLWARSAERWHPGLRVGWQHANSTHALAALLRGDVHAAGIHFCDPRAGAGNAEAVAAAVARTQSPLLSGDLTLVHLGKWEEGLMVAPENPKAIHGVADLARRDVTLINREPGAGSRLLLDALLWGEAVSQAHIAGYGVTVPSHRAVAQAVAQRQADAGMGVASVAYAFGLAFVPLQTVRYDLVLPTRFLGFEPVRQLLETLHHRWVRSQLDALGGYDTTQTGERQALP